MGRVAKSAAAAAVTAGGYAVHRALSRPGRGNWPAPHLTDEGQSRWQVLTIVRSPAEACFLARRPLLCAARESAWRRSQ